MMHQREKIGTPIHFEPPPKSGQLTMREGRQGNEATSAMLKNYALPLGPYDSTIFPL